jgi:Flp pilus assembly pilin Flp
MPFVRSFSDEYAFEDAPGPPAGDEGGGNTVQASLNRLWWTLRREAGQTMAEYAVILAVITLVVVVAITALSGGIESALDKVTALLNGAGG